MSSIRPAPALLYKKPDPTLPAIAALVWNLLGARHPPRFQMARLLGTDMATWGTYEPGRVRIPPSRPASYAYGVSTAFAESQGASWRDGG